MRFSPWISVKHERPKKHEQEEIIALQEDAMGQVERFIAWVGSGDVMLSHDPDFQSERVTHWLPIPPDPE